MGALLRRLDAWQRTRAWAGFPFAVVKKFSEDQAGNLAALVAYYAFFSVFPLLLAFATILGFILHGHPELARSIEHSAFSQLPLVSDKNQPAPLTGNVAALVVGISLALWSGLGVAKSAQTAFNTVYLVAHTDRPNFLRSTLRALALVAIGYRSLSLVPSAVGPVKAMLLDLDAGKAAALVNPMLESPTGSVAIRAVNATVICPNNSGGYCNPGIWAYRIANQTYSQAAEAFPVGHVFGPDYSYVDVNALPQPVVTRYHLGPNFRYVNENGSVYVVNPNTYRVVRVISVP